MTHARWRWDKPLEGTTLFPQHRRWDCRLAIISALRALQAPIEREQCARMLGRAAAFNAIMFDCRDPLASAYAERIERVQTMLDGVTS